MSKDESAQRAQDPESLTVPLDRMTERLAKHARKVDARQLAIADLLQSSMPGAPADTLNKMENTDMNIYESSAIAASRSRISAGVDAFERIISTKPVVIDAECDSPEALLDSLSRSAIATAAADLAAFARGPAATGADSEHPTHTIEQPAIEHDDAAPIDPDEQE